MNKILFLLSILFVLAMMFVDYKQGFNCSPFPQFTEQELEFICIEEGIY